MMMTVVDALEERYIRSLRAFHELTGPAVCSVNVIRGGTQVNVIPQSCEIEVDRRTVPGEDTSEVLAEIEQLLSDLRASHPGLSVAIRDRAVHAALDPSAGASFARHIGKMLAVTGLPSEPIGVAYGSDAGDLAHANIPTVVLGPGDIAQAHGPIEWLELGDLGKAVDAYAKIMSSPIALEPEET
jgi:acetylornithine deacetylase